MDWIVGTAHAMGAQPAGGGEPSIVMQFMPFILIFVVFYFLLIRPQQKKAKEHREMLNALKVGDAVLTAGGMFGRIIEDKGDAMVVDLGETKVTMGRQFLSPAPGTRAAAPLPPKKEKKGKKDDAKQTTKQEAAPAEAAPVVESAAVETPSVETDVVSKKDGDDKPVGQ